MSRNIQLTRSAALALAIAFLAGAHFASASSVTTPVTLPNGTFSSMLSGSGNAQITGASGNYRDWTSLGSFLGWQSVNIGISAANQTVGISMPNVNINNNVASGAANIDYDDVAPGTPQALNSLTADLNGVGGSNQNYNFAINVGALEINVGSLFDADLLLTVNGMITDATFTSDPGSVPASPYAIDGVLNLTIQATVTGVLDVFGGINLGTLFTLNPTAIPINTTLPGAMLLTDLSGGTGPYPADMAVDLAAAVPFPINVPFMLPFDTNQTFPQVGHNDQFTSLVINPGSQLNLTMTLGNPSYSLNGTVPMALVPEPSTLALLGFAAAGLVAVGVRRRRRT